MNTRICRINPADIEKNIIEEAGRIIKEGGLVAFPTETVYGLGADAFNPEASRKIYAAKGRPSDNPLIVHIAELAALDKLAAEIPDVASKIMEEFWPGPLTVIFKKKSEVPKETTGGLDTVAVRMPIDPVAREFILAAGGYIAAPSANISGRPSPTSAKYVIQDMDSRIDMILCGDDSQIGLESTIVDVTGKTPMILRPGFITESDLERVCGNVETDKTILRDDCGQAPKAPGMKYRHYAPKGLLTIVEGDSPAVIEFINKRIESDRRDGFKTGVIATDETTHMYDADVVYSAGCEGDSKEAAHRLFTILRSFDDEEVERMYSVSFGTDGLGIALMNRLLKAAGHNVVSLDDKK